MGIPGWITEEERAAWRPEPTLEALDYDFDTALGDLDLIVRPLGPKPSDDLAYAALIGTRAARGRRRPGRPGGGRRAPRRLEAGVAAAEGSPRPRRAGEARDAEWLNRRLTSATPASSPNRAVSPAREAPADASGCCSPWPCLPPCSSPSSGPRSSVRPAQRVAVVPSAASIPASGGPPADPVARVDFPTQALGLPVVDVESAHALVGRRVRHRPRCPGLPDDVASIARLRGGRAH